MKNALQVSIFSVNCPASKITRHHAVGLWRGKSCCPGLFLLSCIYIYR